MSEIKFSGQDKVSANFSRLQSSMLAAVKSSMEKVGNNLREAAVSLTPIDTGALRQSAFSELIESGNENVVTVCVGYEKDVGEDEGYSVYVHERLDLHHNVGQAKFLETPFKELESHYVQDVSNDLQKVLK